MLQKEHGPHVVSVCGEGGKVEVDKAFSHDVGVFAQTPCAPLQC